MKKIEIPSRYPSRASENREEIVPVLDEVLFCTVSYVWNGEPKAISTGFVRMGESLFIHGSIKSHFLSDLLNLEGTVIITCFIADALVLADSAFDHSVNYRSVTIRSQVNEVAVEAYDDVLRAFTEKYIPGRWDTLRPMAESEKLVTRVISFALDNAVLKSRSGDPGMPKAGYDPSTWLGEIPLFQGYGAPIPFDPYNHKNPIPEHVQELLKKGGNREGTPSREQ